MARRPKPRFQGITDAELNVLKVLWDVGEESPVALRDRLEEQGTEWAYTTVQTLLHRLHRKGYVGRRKEGVAQLYTATVSREDVLVEHMDELAERVCDGASSPLLLGLVRAKGLSRAEIARLREILDAAEGAKRATPQGKARRKRR